MSIRVRLGRSGLMVSPICFGTWQLSPRFWGQVPADDIVAAARRAFDLGVNFYDTAGAYGDGLAERVLGQAIAPLPRDQIVVATKVYWHFHPDGRRHPDLSARYVKQCCDEALGRMGLEYIDLYQLHTFDPMTPLAETTAALDQLKAAGKIRAYGVSNFSVEQLRLARQFGDYATHQPKYSLLDRQIEADLLPYCQGQDVGVLVYSPLAMGLLSGKYTGSESFTDHRARHPRFTGQRFGELASAVRGLKPLADKYGLTIAQLVLAATLCNPGVHVAIAGVKNARQIEETAGAMGASIEREDYFAIRAAVHDV